MRFSSQDLPADPQAGDLYLKMEGRGRYPRCKLAAKTPHGPRGGRDVSELKFPLHFLGSRMLGGHARLLWFLWSTRRGRAWACDKLCNFRA